MSVSRIFHAWPKPIGGSETLPGSLTGKKFTQRSSSGERAALQKIIRSEAPAKEIYAARAGSPVRGAAHFRLSPDFRTGARQGIG
jgi:hypothetical protein